MATWAEIEREVPELAREVRARFAAGKHSTMATLRRDGGPRISGTEVAFEDGDVWLGSMPGAVKARDLQRDPRLAIHSPTAEPDEAGTSWAGEAKLSGTAHEVPAEDASHKFRVDISEIVLTRLGDPADHLVIESWHQGRGYTSRRRR
ncbi:MAG TPA: pyridoxamine 5'-phosphate oxidase family protein [Frankiaceae bacterium]|nr:pyridoxamine 5'-phosphate oxidase family protein [Frankiaceae bacterium]